MPVHKSKTHPHSLPRSGPQTNQKTTKRWGLRWILPIGGLLATIWFLIRTVPKPSRATYPCQQVAMPLAGGFLLWVGGVLTSALACARARHLVRRSRWVAAGACLAIAVAAAWLTLGDQPLHAVDAPAPRGRHAPIGDGKGIHPGRVVWVHDPYATDWEGTDDAGNDIGDGYWWESEHTNQDAVDDMLSQAVRALSGEDTDLAAWDAILRHFNQAHGRGDVGYQSGEKIAIKVNLVTAMGSVDANGNQTQMLGFVNTSPQVILALLRQLVNVVSVNQSDITVGDPLCLFPNHYWDHCHAEFPNVNYVQRYAAWGRKKFVSSQGTADETRIYWSTPGAVGKTPDYLPVHYCQAAYMINAACLKGHGAGVTLCAKNHYGSLGYRQPPAAGYYSLHDSLANFTTGTGHYRALVDIIGHSRLGGNTVLYLIDGLYGGYYWEGHPRKWTLPPFGDGVSDADWPSSLFASSDPVAIDSVAYDFLRAQWPGVVTGGEGAPGSLQSAEQDYLHEAALADNAPSGTAYDPDGGGQGLPSLGAHEHWNDPINKQYSGNLGGGGGIELIQVSADQIGDLNCDGATNGLDIAAYVMALTDPAGYTAAYPGCDGVDIAGELSIELFITLLLDD